MSNSGIRAGTALFRGISTSCLITNFEYGVCGGDSGCDLYFMRTRDTLGDNRISNVLCFPAHRQMLLAFLVFVRVGSSVPGDRERWNFEKLTARGEAGI